MDKSKFILASKAQQVFKSGTIHNVDRCRISYMWLEVGEYVHFKVILNAQLVVVNLEPHTQTK